MNTVSVKKITKAANPSVIQGTQYLFYVIFIIALFSHSYFKQKKCFALLAVCLLLKINNQCGLFYADFVYETFVKDI